MASKIECHVKAMLSINRQSQPSQFGHKISILLRKPHFREQHLKVSHSGKIVYHQYPQQQQLPTMLTKYLTSVTTAFSPFNPKSGKTARNFLAMLPPNARTTMAIDVKILSQAQKSLPATLALKFSACKTLL